MSADKANDNKITPHLLISAIIFVTISGCGTREVIVNPRPVKNVLMFSDSTFFTDISACNFYADRYFVSDRNRGQIFELDSDLNLLFTYGQTGEGPGEFAGLPTFAIDGGNIYAVNEGKQTIEMFELRSPKPSKTIRIPGELIGSTIEHRFFSRDFKITTSASENGIPVCTFDTSSTVRSTLGRVYEFNNAFQNKIRNYRYVFGYGEKIIAVSDNVAAVEVYSRAGDLIRTTEIQEAEPIKDRQYFIDEKGTREENSYYRIFRDVYYDGNKLYLLCIGGREDPVCRQVLVYSMGQNDMLSYDYTINLPGEWYASICAAANRLLAFETTKDELQLYDL